MTAPFLLSQEARHAALQADVRAAQEAHDKARARGCTQSINRTNKALRRAVLALMGFQARTAQ